MKKKTSTIIVSIILSICLLSISAFAALPNIKDGVENNITRTITLGQSYTFRDLSEVFEDADGDEVIYVVIMEQFDDEGKSVAYIQEEDIDKNYVYTPQASGKYIFKFVGKDGEYSYGLETYVVELIVKPNVPPKRVASVPAEELVDSEVGNEYELNLEEIFEDENGDDLNFKVKIDDASYISANKNFSYQIEKVGDTVLVFKANDGVNDSEDLYTVIITATNYIKGSATISGNAVFGEQLTVSTAMTNELGTLSYQWQADSSDIYGAVNKTYTLREDDIGKVITCKVTDEDTGNGSRDGFIESNTTNIVLKAEQNAPNPPTMQSNSSNSITLNPIEGYQYSISGGSWQSSEVFTGLTASTSYEFYQRIAETNTHRPSPASAEAAVFSTTEKPIGNIYIETMPEKITYVEREILDLTGIEVVVRYEDGSEDIKGKDDISSVPSNGTVLENVGENQTVTVTYGGQNASFNITVVERVDAQKPVITSDLTDQEGKLNSTISLGVTAETNDLGSLSYKWFKVEDRDKNNPQEMPSILKTYNVDTSIEGVSYYYCEVTNENDFVNGNPVAVKDSSVAKVNIYTDKSIVSYNPVTFTQTGDIAHNNVQYQTSSEVISALPANVTVTLEDSSTKSIPVTWVDIDGYDAEVAGEYTFNATWGILPSGVDNNDNILPPSCEVKVTKGSTGGGSSYTPKPKTPTEKANEEIKKAKPDKDGILNVSVKAKTSRNGITSFEFPNNFLNNERPVQLTIETNNLQISLSSSMFAEKQRKAKLIMQPAKKEDLGLSDEEREKIGDLPVYSICLIIDGKKIDWNGDEDIVITIKLDDREKNKEEHRFVAVYYDRKGNIQVLKSSYYKDGKLYLKTKHLSDYGVMYIEPTFKDIKNHWAQEAIEALSVRGIIKGISKEEFRPEETISRADLVTLMVRMFGFTSDSSDEFTSDSEKVFEDVDSSEYYAKPIMIAKELGLVKGYVDNTFKPLESVSRQDMMVLLKRAIGISKEFPNIKTNGKSYLNCSDSDEILNYAIESVEMMVNSEIVRTRLEKICPKENATRAEVADALYNIIKTNIK